MECCEWKKIGLGDVRGERACPFFKDYINALGSYSATQWFMERN
jgi:hypothetical protein